MTGHEVTVTSGPCGILHITFGRPDQDADPAQEALDQLVRDLDLIARAHSGWTPPEDQHATQPTTDDSHTP